MEAELLAVAVLKPVNRLLCLTVLEAAPQGVVLREGREHCGHCHNCRGGGACHWRSTKAEGGAGCSCCAGWWQEGGGGAWGPLLQTEAVGEALGQLLADKIAFAALVG